MSWWTSDGIYTRLGEAGEVGMATGDGSTQDGDVERVEMAGSDPSHPESSTHQPTPPASPGTPTPAPPQPYPPGGYPVPAGGYPPAPYGYPPPRPPGRPRRRIWPYVVAAIVLAPLLFVGCAYVFLDRVTDRVVGDNGTGDDDAADDPPAIEQARVTECEASESGRLRAVVVVENTTSDTWTYSVEINFFAPDGTDLGEGFGLVSGLPSGATSTPVQVTDSALAPPDGYTCSVAAVTRV